MAEVTSRFTSTEAFVEMVESFGFKLDEEVRDFSIVRQRADGRNRRRLTLLCSHSPRPPRCLLPMYEGSKAGMTASRREKRSSRHVSTRSVDARPGFPRASSLAWQYGSYSYSAKLGASSMTVYMHLRSSHSNTSILSPAQTKHTHPAMLQSWHSNQRISLAVGGTSLSLKNTTLRVSLCHAQLLARTQADRDM